MQQSVIPKQDVLSGMQHAILGPERESCGLPQASDGDRSQLSHLVGVTDRPPGRTSWRSRPAAI